VEVTPELLQDLRCEVIVVATGSEPNLPGDEADSGALSRALGRQVLPAIPGLDLPHVVSADRVLAGEVKPSGRVLLVDDNGHWEAAGTAEFMADLGCEVIVIAGHSLVGSELEGGTRTLFYRRAAIKGLRLRPSTLLVAVEPRRAQIAQVFSRGDTEGWGKYVLIPGEEEWIEDLDWVVPVMGRRSREDLYLKLRERPDMAERRIERVGDCVAPRLIQSNILEAHQLAETL
jgi:hypothetical protein